MTDYDKVVVWILRENHLNPIQLKQQYVDYKDKRAAFEEGHGTVDDMAACLTPGVAAMLDLEDQMLADLTAEQQVKPVEQVVMPTGHHYHVDAAAWLVMMSLCCVILVLGWVVLNA